MARLAPEQYNWDKLEFDLTLLSKHFTRQDGVRKKCVVIHHTTVPDRDVNAPDVLDACWRIWQERKASAHYGVDGRFVRQFVYDKDYAWATGSTAGNRDGISLEMANLTGDQPGTENDWLVNEETWRNTAKLAAYLHLVYVMGRPVADVTLRKHKSFTSTACPGPFMDRIWPQFVAEAQRVYDLIAAGRVPSTPGAPAPAPATKTIAQLADEVLAGKHGNGDDRRRSLGANYDAVQAEVNRRAGAPAAPPAQKSVGQLADEVMAGHHGNGDARIKSLGSRYNEVQAEINRRAGQGAPAPRPNIGQLAEDVIAGKYGTGADRKRRLGALYNQVQAEVNRRLAR